MVTVVASYVCVGTTYGAETAIDGRWAAVFLANLHFVTAALNVRSPLAHYWSLSVEEQFYLVFPAAVLLLARRSTRSTLRSRLSIGLCIIVIASYTLSILMTRSNEIRAYVSPFTRAWEIALGALAALATPLVRRLPGWAAASVSWLGLSAIVWSAFAFDSIYGYPGSEVAVPVLGAALVIVGGTAAPRFGAESVLGWRPMRLVGQHSYSLYLWNTPVIIIAGVALGATADHWYVKCVLAAIMAVLTVGTYRFVEQPVRHWRASPMRCISYGAAGVGATCVLLTALIAIAR